VLEMAGGVLGSCVSHEEKLHRKPEGDISVGSSDFITFTTGGKKHQNVRGVSWGGTSIKVHGFSQEKSIRSLGGFRPNDHRILTMIISNNTTGGKKRKSIVGIISDR